MWPFDFNLSLYQIVELLQNGTHPMVDAGCVIYSIHLMAVFWRRRAFGLPSRLAGKLEAVR
jgi:hypothetical protein